MWNESRSSSLAPERLSCRQNTSVFQRRARRRHTSIQSEQFQQTDWETVPRRLSEAPWDTHAWGRFGRPDYWLTCSPFSKVTCLVHWRNPPEPNERDIIMWRGVFILYSLDLQWVANYSSGRSKVRPQGFFTLFPWGDERQRRQDEKLNQLTVSTDWVNEAGSDSAGWWSSPANGQWLGWFSADRAVCDLSYTQFKIKMNPDMIK